MFRSKYIDVKRHSVCFPEIERTFAVSDFILNLIASQIGEFFLPHPVLFTNLQRKYSKRNKSLIVVVGTFSVHSGGSNSNCICKTGQTD